MTPSARERRCPARKWSITMNREKKDKDLAQRSRSAHRSQRRGSTMRVIRELGTMLMAGVLAPVVALRAQEMQMPKQEQHIHMEIPAVKQEYPRMGRAQENAKGAVVTLEQMQKMASEANPTLRQAEAEIRAAKARQQQSGLYPNPTAAYTGDEIRGGAVGGGEEGVFVQQTLVTGGKVWLGREGLRKDIKLAEIEAQEKKKRRRSGV